VTTMKDVDQYVPALSHGWQVIQEVIKYGSLQITGKSSVKKVG